MGMNLRTNGENGGRRFGGEVSEREEFTPLRGDSKISEEDLPL